MQTRADTPADAATPKIRGMFEVVFAALFLAGNLLVLAAAWQDQSWGALAMAIVGSPFLNGLFLISGLAAIPILQRRRTHFSLGRYLALTVGGPIAAAAANYLTIMSMDLHGC